MRKPSMLSQNTARLVIALLLLLAAFFGFWAKSGKSFASLESFQAHQGESTSIGTIAWETCPPRGASVERKCGKLEVFEDRTKKTGRKISLNIVVIPATGPNRQPDPIFFFAGGPGQGSAAGAGSAGRIAADRDQVFIDQRGTGQSNPMNCTEFDDARDLQGFFGEIFPLEKMRQCREKVEKIANPLLYTTSIAMDDIDDVRQALGYDKINLFGVSYGTQAAQVYLRQHSQHVRTVLLEGVAPLFTKQPLQFAKGAQDVMNHVLDDCEADQPCNTAFPNLRKEFATLLSRFDKGPVSFEMTNPVTQNKETVKMLRGNFVVRLLSMLYTPATASRVPFLIHKAFEGDLEPFARFAIAANAGGSVARGMYFTVTCSEAVQFITEKEIKEQNLGTFIGDYRTRAHMAACKEWPTAKVSPKHVEPVKSDAPVLMISGLVDAATPYWLGQEAVKYLSNGRQVLAKNTGHGFGDPCIQNIVAEFIKKGSAKDLNTACTDDIKRRPFMISPPQ